MWVRPDIVKLDLELTRAIHSDPVRMALVESLVRFSRRVGATVCAEGIESHDDIEALSNLDVPWGQGYAIGRPAPPWSQVSPPAAETCRAALAKALISTPGGDTPTISAGDRRLEHLSARLANARDRADLNSALDLIAGELHADKVSLSQYHPDMGVVETLAESGEQPGEEFFSVDEYPTTGRVLERQESAQVMLGDPRADPQEIELMFSLGYRTLLMVPVVQRGESARHRRGHVPRGAALDPNRDEPRPHRGQPARFRHPDLLPGPGPGALRLARDFAGARSRAGCCRACPTTASPRPGPPGHRGPGTRR